VGAPDVRTEALRRERAARPAVEEIARGAVEQPKRTTRRVWRASLCSSLIVSALADLSRN
jgi:hypothetical protein